MPSILARLSSHNRLCAPPTSSAVTLLCCCAAAAIATGMDWRELEQLIKEERRAGNPVAGLIHSLQLDQNKITLLLSNLLDEEEVGHAAQRGHGGERGRARGVGWGAQARHSTKQHLLTLCAGAHWFAVRASFFHLSCRCQLPGALCR